MKPDYQIRLCPQPKQEIHFLTLTLQGTHDPHGCSVEMLLDLRRSAPRLFHICLLPSPMRAPGVMLIQLDNDRSELILPLAGADAPVVIHDLSDAPVADWLTRMSQLFSKSQAAVAVWLVQGKLTIILHEGGAP